jgi:hypothetical protein
MAGGWREPGPGGVSPVLIAGSSRRGAGRSTVGTGE